MNNDVFATRLARGAAAAVVASLGMIPQNKTGAMPLPPGPQEVACTDRAELPVVSTRSCSENTFVFAMPNTPSTWSKRLEREFRKLALLEAKSELSSSLAERLEELNQWRNQLLHGQTPDELLQQLRREKLLTRMRELLEEYVKFEETAGRERSPT